jgi:hypothetical protein
MGSKLLLTILAVNHSGHANPIVFVLGALFVLAIGAVVLMKKGRR